MKRARAASILVAVCMAAALPALPAGAARRVPRDEPSRGLRYRGLQVRPERCGSGFLLSRSGFCTAGPDPRPLHAASDRLPLAILDDDQSPPSTRTSRGTACDGDGSTGLRAQALYATASFDNARFTGLRPQIQQWASAVDDAVAASATQTTGTRGVRFVTGDDCLAAVQPVVVSPGAMASFDQMILELDQLGFSRDDRKYLVWADTDPDAYCGIATVYIDDLPVASNDNNRFVGYARVDPMCWGHTYSVEAHELMHMLGAVQDSAPHSTAQQASPGGHCSDDYDRMCYPDFPGVTMSYGCPVENEALFDCGNDDYFSTDPNPDDYLYSHWNAADSGWLIPDPTQPGRFVPLAPARILDTRFGTGGISGRVGQDREIELRVTGVGGIPSSGVAAVALNVTVTGTNAPGFLTVWPGGQPRPVASNLNWAAGATVANLVAVKVGPGGTVRVYNALGDAHVIFDVAGWYWQSSPGAPGRLQTVVPTRIRDTRINGGRLGPGGELVLPIRGSAGVPAGAAGAVLNVTVTNTTGPSFLTVYPDGQPRPNASNLNWDAGDTVANRVMVKLGDNGNIRLSNALGQTDVVVDVNGWFTDSSVITGFSGALRGLQPLRIYDTRFGTGGRTGALDVESVNVQIPSPVPLSASAVVLNVTATEPSAGGFFTIYPTGEALPIASDVNFSPGKTVANLVVVKLGSQGRVAVYNALGRTHVIVDLVGWFD